MKTRLFLIVFLLIAGLSFAQPIRQPSGFAPPSTGGSGEAEGTAVAADVLAGKTFSNDSAVGISGSMTNRGAVNITPGTSSQAIPAGYHNGSGSVAGDSDLTANKIASGTAIFGVAGTFSPLASVTGTLYRQVELGATGTVGDVFCVKGDIYTVGQALKTANVDAALPGSGRSVAFSADGQFMAATSITSPYLRTYKWSAANSRYEATAVQDANPPGIGRGVAMSADGQFMAVISDSIPFYLVTYRWSAANNRYQVTTQADTAPPGKGYGAAMSADGQMLAVVSETSPFLRAYRWSGDRYEMVAAQDTNPPGDSRSVSMSADGQMLAVGSLASPYLRTYKWSAANSRYEATAAQDTNPPGGVYGVSMSADGTYLAAACDTTPFLRTYKWSSANNRFEATTAQNTNPPGISYSAAMSADGQYLAVISYASPYLRTYQWSATNNRYETTTIQDVNPAGIGYGGAMSPDGRYLAVVGDGSPYITTYLTAIGERLSPALPLVASSGYSLIPYNIAYIGALMQSGVASDVVDFAAFWWRQDLLPPAE